MSAKLDEVVDEVVPEVQSDEELPAEYHGLTNVSRAVASDQSLASLDATKELPRLVSLAHSLANQPGAHSTVLFVDINGDRTRWMRNEPGRLPPFLSLTDTPQLSRRLSRAFAAQARRRRCSLCSASCTTSSSRR